MGTTQSFGVLFSELLTDFQSGVGETSWIPSLNTGIFFVSGPIVGYLEQKYGYRAIAITGAIIITVGMFVSGFVTSLYYLYITYGVICDAAERKGFGKDKAAFLITTSGISGIVGRAVVGYIADKPYINKCLLNSTALISGGIATIGTFAFLQGVITVDIMGKQLLSLAFGYLVLFQGVSATVGPPIIGWIVDATVKFLENI
ncbi:hypothetical protein KUTeg_010218 [Tegillarca granosa]|uniref:Major facilitator superfamily (MFS) profile domain-containing protein n=1 Tax=Tegillarca granosa TaxID=220873 RepID=A0ABQ9F633_TEGGR|nr:hypothetical protein KUTeg_010218 [Tegillarca granosa]